MPPLTCNVSPVIYSAKFEDKKTTAFATSSGSPKRLSEILSCKLS